MLSNFVFIFSQCNKPGKVREINLLLLRQIKGSFFACPEHSTRYIRSNPSVREGASASRVAIGMNTATCANRPNACFHRFAQIYPQASHPR